MPEPSVIKSRIRNYDREMKRKEYNESILERCTELLQSCCPNNIYEGLVLSAYLIEQSFKSELKKVNPLLYFDKKCISDEMEVRVALGKLSKEELNRLKTSTAKRCVAQMCEYKNELAAHKANLEELFKIRNSIIHSTDDLSLNEDSIAETAVSALRACRKYVIKYSGISADKFNPLTSSEFEKMQEKKRKKRIRELKEKIKGHKKIFEKLNQLERSQKIHSNLPKTDTDTWIEDTVQCPACGQLSLDKVGTVDFDWNPDGIIESGEYRYHCRCCELKLSEYEHEIISLF
jgi:rubrerythrin